MALQACCFFRASNHAFLKLLGVGRLLPQIVSHHSSRSPPRLKLHITSAFGRSSPNWFSTRNLSRAHHSACCYVLDHNHFASINPINPINPINLADLQCVSKKPFAEVAGYSYCKAIFPITRKSVITISRTKLETSHQHFELSTHVGDSEEANECSSSRSSSRRSTPSEQYEQSANSRNSHNSQERLRALLWVTAAAPVAAFCLDEDVSKWNDVFEKQIEVAYLTWLMKQRAKRKNDGEDEPSGDETRTTNIPKQVVVDWQVIHEKIDRLVKTRRVVVFIKGTPDRPKCRFSKKAVAVLHEHGCDNYTYVNVLDSPVLREGIKRYSRWPTIPQLYVDGRLVGGVDVLTDLDERNTVAATIADPTEFLGVNADPQQQAPNTHPAVSTINAQQTKQTREPNASVLDPQGVVVS